MALHGVAGRQHGCISNWESHAGLLGHSSRKLLDIAMIPSDPVNATYPNATVYVDYVDPYTQGCAPW